MQNQLLTAQIWIFQPVHSFNPAAIRLTVSYSCMRPANPLPVKAEDNAAFFVLVSRRHRDKRMSDRSRSTERPEHPEIMIGGVE